MAVKGTLQPNHLPKNSGRLAVTGTLVPEFTILSVSGLMAEVDSAELPDRTVVSGGNLKPGELTVRTPTHHTIEQVAWEAWHLESHGAVLPTYKKAATLSVKSLDGATTKSWELVGCWAQKYEVSEFEMANEADMTETTWTVKYDQAVPLPIG